MTACWYWCLCRFLSTTLHIFLHVYMYTRVTVAASAWNSLFEWTGVIAVVDAVQNEESAGALQVEEAAIEL